MGSFNGDIVIRNHYDGNEDQWTIDEPFTYWHKFGEITVKPGAITDGASVPKILTNFIPRISDPNVFAAAMIHDQLYKTQGARGIFTRWQSDRIFRDALQDAGEPPWKAWFMWAGVRIGGWLPWGNSFFEDQMNYIEVKQ